VRAPQSSLGELFGKRSVPKLGRVFLLPLATLVDDPRACRRVMRAAPVAAGLPARPVRPERAGQLKSPEPPARGSFRDLAIGIDAAEIDGRCGPYPTAGPRGSLDRVAQMADRKYCRPHPSRPQ
jgi:hypothetical protein